MRRTGFRGDVVQRRTLRVLVVGQVFGGVGVGSGIAVGGLIAEDVSGSTALSGFAQTATVLGAAVAALPMARLMSARARRPGLGAGYTVAMCGAIVVVLGSVVESFVLVLLGAAMLGSGARPTCSRATPPPTWRTPSTAPGRCRPSCGPPQWAWSWVRT